MLSRTRYDMLIGCSDCNPADAQNTLTAAHVPLMVLRTLCMARCRNLGGATHYLALDFAGPARDVALQHELHVAYRVAS